ncbi:MAG: chemotaxis protein CheC [Lachnospiraceae bacterium]|nr:chemotaxis protein CheC [Lachnospiraceae bacterium]MCI8825107.1 chemotaxis protein CheC [Lachnospiraceae bacterium]MDE7307701.1 chemotaxis protein CheC [Lachnospiraceae bacterium]
MSKIDLDELNTIQYDVLKEIGNIGAGNATTALSKLINSKVDMRVPKVNLIGFSELAASIGGEEATMMGILLSLSEDIKGMMLFMLDLKSATKLLNMMLTNMGAPEKREDEEFNEMHLSALNEIGNIITGAYLSALSDLTRLSIVASVPHLQIDMAGAILSLPAIEFGKIGDKVLYIETTFNEESEINGYFILVPELDSYDRILESLGIC